MIASLKIWLALSTDRRAVTAMEYGLITALIAAVIVAAVSSLGNGISGTFLYIAGSL